MKQCGHVYTTEQSRVGRKERDLDTVLYYLIVMAVCSVIIVLLLLKCGQAEQIFENFTIVERTRKLEHNF